MSGQNDSRQNGKGAHIDRARAERLMRLATYASVTTATLLIAAKIAALAMSGSLAMLSSLIDSGLDAMASVVNLFAVRHALQPADQEHRFGHGKAEALAALGQAAFIAGSAVFLIYAAIDRLISPSAVHNGSLAIGVMAMSIVLTMVLVLFQHYVVKRTGSLAISADQLHYKSDLLANIGVIAAIAATVWLGWWWADPLFAGAVALYILYSAVQIFKGAYDNLMDRELPDEQRDLIRDIVLRHPDVRAMHDLRTRASGSDIFIQLHLELDGNMKLYRAHVIADTVEAEILQQFPNAEVIIHQDPAGVEQELPAHADRHVR